MAKKRKVKKKKVKKVKPKARKKTKKARKAKKAKTRVKRVKARVAKKKIVGRAIVQRSSRFEAAYTLSVAGGIIILIAGILAILGIEILGEQALAIATTGMAVGLICGLAILIATAAARRKPRMAGIFILVFSLLALATPPTYGLIFGPVLSLIGSIIFLMQR